MDFINQLKQFYTRIAKMKNSIQTEETTKTSMIEAVATRDEASGKTSVQKVAEEPEGETDAAEAFEETSK